VSEATDTLSVEAEEDEEDQKDEEEERKGKGEEKKDGEEEGQADTDDCVVCPGTGLLWWNVFMLCNVSTGLLKQRVLFCKFVTTETQLSDDDRTQDLLMAPDAGAEVSLNTRLCRLWSLWGC